MTRDERVSEVRGSSSPALRPMPTLGSAGTETRATSKGSQSVTRPGAVSPVAPTSSAL